MGAAKQVAVLINTPLNVKIISCIKVLVEFDNKHETEKISDISNTMDRSCKLLIKDSI